MFDLLSGYVKHCFIIPSAFLNDDDADFSFFFFS